MWVLHDLSKYFFQCTYLYPAKIVINLVWRYDEVLTEDDDAFLDARQCLTKLYVVLEENVATIYAAYGTESSRRYPLSAW